jgi:broad specificity phosphatase PhoE
MERSDVTLKLFGKSAAELLPAITEGFRAAADGAQKMSNATVDALERAEDAWTKLRNTVVIVSGTIIAGTIDTTTHITSSWQNFWQFMKDSASMGVGMAAALATANERIKTSVDDFVGPLEKGLHATKAETEGAEAAAKKYADAWAELSTVGTSYKDTVAQINPKIAEQAEYYLKAGASIATVAAAFPQLSAAQVKALDEMVKQYEATYKAIQKIEESHVKQQETNIFGLSKAENDASQKSIENWGKANAEIQKLNQALTDDYNKQSMDRYTYQVMKIWDGVEQEIAAFKKTGVTAEQVTQYSNALYEQATVKISELSTVTVKASETAAGQMKSLWEGFDRALSSAKGNASAVAQEAAAALSSTMQQVVNIAATADDNITQNGIDAMNRLLAEEQRVTDLAAKAAAEAAAKLKAANTYQGGEKLPGSTTVQEFGQNYIISPTGARVPMGPHGEIPKNFDDLYAGRSSFPQFAGGVQNFSGGLALVGEKGPELVNLPGGSDVIPNSRMGGGGVSITIHVTQPFGTPEAIARAVADAQVSLMRGQGVRLPYGT